MQWLIISVLLGLNIGCTSNETAVDKDSMISEYAVVKKVEVLGKGGSYTFSVTLKSPDTGCGQFADWWEVLTEDGELIYRRVLLHSHVSEQPFTRSGGAVNITAAQVVIVRAHMNTTGYGEGEVAMKGSVESGFQPLEIKKTFAAEVEKQAPLPTGCAF